MKTQRLSTAALLTLAVSAVLPNVTRAAIPAFPGADGAGMNATGGRGGDVYHVTKLDTSSSDNSPGTLRHALSSATGPRTIVFDVSGVFFLGKTFTGWDSNGNGWDTSSRLNIPSNVTIAGQTAPGPVIITGGVTKVSGSNAILRNLTFAPGYGTRGFSEQTKPPAAGDFPDSYVYDALDISGKNLVIDHVTTVYATDETVSMNEAADNVTVQWSNISLGQNYPQADAEASGVKYTGHALGSLLQAGSNAKISLHHNLYAHQKGRLPRVGTEASKLTVAGVGAFNDFRNNVFYNWLGTAGSGASGQPSQNNFIANFWLAGKGGDDPVGGTSTAITTAQGGTGIFSGSDSTNTKVYHSGNVKDVNKDADPNDTVNLTNADFGSSNFQASAFTQTPYVGVTDTAQVALQRVLNYVGANWENRTALDQRIVADVRNGTGKIQAWADDPFNNDPNEGAEWRALRATPQVSRPAGFDSDNDGMPDAWEGAHGLNPKVADNNGDFDSDGYTNLEEYLNDTAAFPAPKALIFTPGGPNARYEQTENWDIPWQPSRFDEAQVNSGVATLSSVGQHARVLKVAANAGNSASFNITGGWIEVSESLLVGPGGSGAVTQTGGTVIATQSVVLGGQTSGAQGTYTLAGGALVTPLLAKLSGAFHFTGGELHAGEVLFDLVNEGGTLSPGNSIGATHVAGSLTILGGSLAIELNGSQSDTLLVDGPATLGGTLDVSLLGPLPAGGGRWLILSAASLTGEFAHVTSGYAVEKIGGNLYLTIPEPTVLPALGAAGLFSRRARR